MLTPSPNPDTDVLLPPPHFTPQQGHSRSRGALLAATRQHPIRKSSILSDMEEDSLLGGSQDGDKHPVAPTHAASSSISGKSYPGVAIPVVQRAPPVEVGQEAVDRSRPAPGEAVDSRPADLFSVSKSTTLPNRFFNESFPPPKRDTKDFNSVGHLDTSHSLDELELSANLTVDYLQDKLLAASAPPSRSSPSTTKPSLTKSFSVSPKKGPTKSDPIPIPKKVFTSHSRSKSSVSLKPEKAFELAQSARDDISLLQRETSAMTLGSSNLYELLSKTSQVSPSHTEMCLTSLERPSTPTHKKHLSSIHKVSSLPLQHSRDRSPSPVRGQTPWRLERQAAQFHRDNTYDMKDLELGRLRRTLTHEEEINLIISGDPKYLTKLKSPESYTPPEIPDGDGLLNNDYEMKF
ncbi:hypothetical protein C7M84_009858 [Penaeus vannamei]|uniref:Uncharacterized protein n=1 Tax=Penaeus vannamei TaxID=6689 RepID=A0A423T5U8_PENVA|nr:hypothetical protein C7M84_009858 [Penaeus vannamei]